MTRNIGGSIGTSVLTTLLVRASKSCKATWSITFPSSTLGAQHCCPGYVAG